MRSRLRTAVVGTGFVGPHHVDAIRRGGYAEVVALVGSDPARTKATAQALGVPTATVDFDVVLRDQDIDVIHICTPNQTHVQLGSAVLAAGKHLVLEKPIAIDAAGAAALVAAAARSGRHAMTTLTYRGYPMVRRARVLVAEGELGEIRLVHGGYLQDWLSTASDYNWRVDVGTGGPSRAVADIGTHWLDLAEFVTGVRVEAVFADLATFIPFRERPTGHVTAFGEASGAREQVAVASEDAATVLLRFAGGALGAVVVSQVSPGYKNGLTLEVSGSERSLGWAQERPEYLWIADVAETRVVTRGQEPSTDIPGVPSLPAGHPEGWSEALRDLFRPFYAAVLAGDDPASGTAPYPTLADGQRGIAFVEAVLDSVRRAAWAPMG